MPVRHDRPFNLALWDGEWYLAIAQHGYNGVPWDLGDAFGGRNANTARAFFPGYPWILRAVAPLFGGHYVVAAVTVTTVAGVVAVYGVARLALHVTGSKRAALFAVVLFAAAPMSIVYSLAYPEALFCALAAWALVGVVERRWMLAGLCAAAAGLVRPTAVTLVAVVSVVAAWEVVRRRNWRAAVAAILAPTGLVSYLGWVAIKTGSLTGYHEIQNNGWGLKFDGGAKTAKWSLHILVGNLSVFETMTVMVLLAAIVLLVISARRMPWPLWAYACLIVVLVVGTSGTMHIKMRELLPAFVLLIPVAAGLARQRAITAVCLTAGYVLAGLWIGASSLTAWPYGI
jgi:Gpi18-like mannosyltransferase